MSNEEKWLIEWNEKRKQFHIGFLEDRQNCNGGQWRTIGSVVGSFQDASRWADEWLLKNTEAKRAYDNRGTTK